MVVGMLSLFSIHGSFFFVADITCDHVGASGTGRTTFVNTLCGSNVLAKKVCDNPEEAHNEPGITIKPMSVGKYLRSGIFSILTFLLFWIELDEDGVR